MERKPYGYELILDLHECNPAIFTRKELRKYFKELCKRIDMTRCALHFWDDQGVPDEEKETLPHLKGTSAVQFIMTSNITIHTLDLLKAAYVNIFSCKPFDKVVAQSYTEEFFEAQECASTFIERI